MRFALLPLALLAAGCGSGGNEAKFIPPASKAREALEAALTKWKDGQARPAQFTLGKTAVEVVDQAWASGLKLQAFEIVADESAEGPKVFSVKLTTAKGPQTVKYYVIGNDPLWVYGETDYKKLSGAGT